jgi:tRNA-splicing ligase RtcB
MEISWGSSAHGAGRTMSRTAAMKAAKGRNIDRELRDGPGVILRARERSTVAEEMPEAYKDVDEVVEVVHNAGISRKVARLKPMGVVKG